MSVHSSFRGGSVDLFGGLLEFRDGSWVAGWFVCFGVGGEGCCEHFGGGGVDGACEGHEAVGVDVWGGGVSGVG